MTELTALEVMGLLADQLRDTLGTAFNGVDLQVEPTLVPNPTPPCIDIYPATPFAEPLGYGRSAYALSFVVRARVSTADNEGGQELLLALMDPRADTSIDQAIAADDTLGGSVEMVAVEPESPSGFQAYLDAGSQGELLGCQWQVRIVP